MLNLSVIVMNWAGDGGHVVVLWFPTQVSHVTIELILVALIHSIVAIVDFVLDVGVLINVVLIIVIVLHLFRPIPPLVVRSPASIHKKVSNRGRL